MPIQGATWSAAPAASARLRVLAGLEIACDRSSLAGAVCAGRVKLGRDRASVHGGHGGKVRFTQVFAVNVAAVYTSRRPYSASRRRAALVAAIACSLVIRSGSTRPTPA